VSKGGAARKREGKDTPPPASARVTPPAPRTTQARKVNWLAVVLISLVLVGLVGGFFISLVAGTDPTTTIPSTQGP
jgi:F0F1-type ATP synthase assembly protein I